MRNWSLSDRWQIIGSPGQRGRILTLGHGRDVVFLARPLARGESYIPTALALARHFRTHLIEMSGSGASMRLATPWSVNEYTAWAAETIAARGLAGSAVIGHSYSGMVAIALAARFPELIRALIVADTSGAGEPTSLLRGVGGALIDVVLDLRLVAIAWPHVVGDALTHRRNFFALIRESLTADISGQVRQVTSPALVAWGGRSQFMRPTAAHTLAAGLPRSRVYLCTRGAHTWVVSRAEEFAAAVAAFSEPEA